jgi:DNA-binding NarL/FixJ family response regulator
MDPRVRVMIVDDHAVVRWGVHAYLDSQLDIEVVAEAQDGQEALDVLGRVAAFGQAPDVALMDLVMPRLDGVAATEAITQRHPEVKVVILTSFGELARVRRAIEVGIAGYLLKDAAPDEIASAIRVAAKGEMHLDAAITRQLTRQLAHPPDLSNALTARERDVLLLVAQGKSNRQIAEHLALSERTARAHVSNILIKLGLESRTQAALLAIRSGLAPLPIA